jgi:hypothetical protein
MGLSQAAKYPRYIVVAAGNNMRLSAILCSANQIRGQKHQTPRLFGALIFGY